MENSELRCENPFKIERPVAGEVKVFSIWSSRPRQIAGLSQGHVLERIVPTEHDRENSLIFEKLSAETDQLWENSEKKCSV